jgi:propanediol utilization protein
MWTKYRLRRTKPGWVSEIQEIYEDNILKETSVKSMRDAHAKMILKHGEWQKVEVIEPNGSVVIEMVRVMEPLRQQGYVPISRTTKERTLRKFRDK